MFNRLFGTNTNFDTGSLTSLVEDAMSIRRTVDYNILLVAWNEYVSIKKQDEDYAYGDATPTPAWVALEKLEEYFGDISLFKEDEQNLLRALRKGFFIYADVLHTLMDKYNIYPEFGNEILVRNPQFSDSMPDEYKSSEHVIPVIIEVVRDYQWQLEQFSTKHRDVLLENITRKNDPTLEF